MRAGKLPAGAESIPPLIVRSNAYLFVLLIAATAATPAGAQVVSPAAQEARATQLFVGGMTRAYNHDHAGAIELYDQVLSLRPGDPAVLSALAEAYEAMDDVSAARFHAERAVAAAPAEPDLHRLLADLRLRSGDSDGAIASYESLLALRPHDTGAMTTLARAQQNAGRLADAISTYGRLLDSVGESILVRSRILQLQRRLGDVEGAAETIAALIELDPTNHVLYRQLADMYVALGRPHEAISLLEDHLAQSPADADARLALAELYRQRGDESSARALIDEAAGQDGSPADRLAQALALFGRADGDPAAAIAARSILEQLLDEGQDDPEIRFVLGELHFRSGDFASAAELFATALADDPGHPAAWERLVASRLEAGDAAAAADAGQDALLLFPGQYPLLRVTMFALVRAGRNDQALRRAGEAVDVLADEHPDALEERSAIIGTIALVHMRRNDDAAADASHDEALILDPRNSTALNNYAFNLASRGTRLDDALEMAALAVQIDGDNPSYLDTLGRVHYLRGDSGAALPLLERAVDLARQRGTLSATLLEHLADAHAAAGNASAARTYWEEALDLDPGRESVRARLGR
jgi:tetratricopeptide (TPR) repeat protein